jgi:hypothetical protein
MTNSNDTTNSNYFKKGQSMTPHFETRYINLRNMHKKFMYTDTYIKNASEKFHTISWHSDILDEIFDTLELEDPYKVKMDAIILKRMYWKRYHEKHEKKEVNPKPPKPCPKKLCNGSGVVYATDKKTGRYDYGFICKCVKTDNADRLPKWRDEHSKKYTIKSMGRYSSREKLINLQQQDMVTQVIGMLEGNLGSVKKEKIDCPYF